MENAEAASEGLSEWEQIQSPWPQTPPTTQTTTRVDHTVSVVVTDNYLHHHSSVFPPSDHEDLPITPQHNPPSTLASSCSSTSSISSEGDGLNPVSVTGEIGRRLKLHLGLLSSRIHRIAYAVRSYWVFSGGSSSLLSVTGMVVALVVSLLYVKVQRWRQRVLQENKDRLVLLVKEKDEKISQLLLQIAQMNQILSTRQRVPILRVG